ncbi:MAG: hypothetical protein MUF35_12365 [Candidatus Nanopelagicales bacterium]|nr:hypothetical protein [Candidatus Nanopelagicales bacterium]
MGRDTVVVGGLALVLLAGCAGDGNDTGASGQPSAPGGSPSASAPGGDDGGNGSLYVSDTRTDRKTMTRYPIGADGGLGEPVVVVDTEADQLTFPGVVDGIGDLVLTGTFTEYWTSELQRRDAGTGEVRDTLTVDRWCGGEALTYNACALLDDTRLAHTSDLGGDGLPEGTITISSLADGSTEQTLGPYTGLGQVLGTSDPEVLLITILGAPWGDPPEPQPGEVQQLDVTTGQTTTIGSYEKGWYPICPIGTDSVLGFAPDGSGMVSVVGSATIGAVSWAPEESPLGCSADGRFLYLQTIPQPPGDAIEDTEPPNAPTTVERITLADGSRENVATLDPGTWAEQLTR